MKHINRFDSYRLNEDVVERITDVKNNVTNILSNLIDLIGLDSLSVDSNGINYKVEINYRVDNSGFEDIVSKHSKFKDILDEALESIEKLKLYYNVSYNLYNVKYHNSFSSFSLNVDLSYIEE